MSLGTSSVVKLESSPVPTTPVTVAKTRRQRQSSRQGRAARAATGTKSSQHRNWTPDEDKQLLELVARFDVLKTKRWTHIAELMGTGRIGKQCRDRYLNHIDPCVVKTPWTPEEDRAIIEAQSRLGNVWTKIAEVVGNGRAANGIKNRWNSCLKRRVMLSGKSSGSDCSESSPSPSPPPPAKRTRKNPPRTKSSTSNASHEDVTPPPPQLPQTTDSFQAPPPPPPVVFPDPQTSNNSNNSNNNSAETGTANSSPLSMGTSSVSSPLLFEQEHPESSMNTLPFMTVTESEMEPSNTLNFLIDQEQNPWFETPELDGPL